MLITQDQGHRQDPWSLLHKAVGRAQETDATPQTPLYAPSQVPPTRPL
jgi:hypothetical protein